MGTANQSKAWRAANKEKVAAYNKEYYAANKDAKAAYAREYYEANREAIRVKVKEYQAANREDIAAAKRLKRYGITAADHALMLKEQKNKCKLCKVTFVGKNDKNYKKCLGEYVDHCHTTNKVRGLLCHKCNTGLGLFKDNIKNLQGAIIYLQETA